MDGRLVNTSFSMNDSKEYSLRPVNFNEYIGQSKVKSNLKVFIEAANMRGDALDHVLFYGPPGLGKTTLASIISKEMNSSIRITSGKGPQAKSIRIDLAKFTLVGATTRLGLLTSPLRDRFGVLLPMDYYTNDELKEIIIRSSKILFMEITDDAALEIAKCSRGTPRVANRILKRVRDFAQVKKNNLVDIDLARHSLDLLEIDEFGLDKIDKRILEALVFNFKGGPTGIETIAHFLSEEISTLEDVYEPFLIQQGFIIRTPRGRIATDKTYKYFNINR